MKPRVAIIGLGYVGLPTALAIAKNGMKVVGIDINAKLVGQLNAGKSFINEIKDEEIKAIKENFRSTTDWQELKKCDVILITVPTPLTKNKTPDTSYIEAAGEKISQNLKKGDLVVLKSSTYPGTTEELLKPILEKNGLRAGKDFDLAFAPERIDPGNKTHKFEDVPKVVGGINKKSTKRAAEFFGLFLKKIYPVSSARAAEMTKIYENVFRLVNISLVNELKLLSDKLGINFWEVIEAAKTKPYGFMPFYPGPGVGGHCVPVDPFYLSWKAREVNFFTHFIDAAAKVNESMPHTIVTTIIWALNKRRKTVANSKILVLGAAYKKDIDDPRESPALKIIWDLARKGGKVIYNDPYIPKIEIAGKKLISRSLNKTLVRKADCVVIATDHSAYDYKMIAKNAKLIIDPRNAIKKKGSHII